jgi:predicted secreted protein
MRRGPSLRVIALIVIVAVLGVGCWDRTRTRERTACDPARRQYCDPTRSITVHAGQTFAIIFHANPSVGDLWRLVEPIDTVILRFEGTKVVSDAPARPGSGRTEIWTFAALAPGTATIRLDNHYRNGPVTEHRVYTITVA